MVLPNGVTLRGKHDDAQYERQKLVAGSSFPADKPMVRLKRGSVLQRVWADGMNRAYRIVELTTRVEEPPHPQFRDYVIQENLLRHISNNEIRGAGIHTLHGWGAGYTGQWQTKGRGVLVRRSNDLYIIANQITHTTMAGIDLTSGRTAFLHGNLIEWTGRNSEYKTSKNDRTKTIQDGITGYHNYPGRPADERNEPNMWRITANTVRYAGNHGIHVGGYDIKLLGNTVEKIFQSGINFYDQRNDAEQGYAECNVHVQVGGPSRADKNIVRDTGYTAPDATLYRNGFAWSPVATQLARKARYEGMPEFNMTTEDNDLGGGRVTVDTANASCGHRFGF